MTWTTEPEHRTKGLAQRILAWAGRIEPLVQIVTGLISAGVLIVAFSIDQEIKQQESLRNQRAQSRELVQFVMNDPELMSLRRQAYDIEVLANILYTNDDASFVDDMQSYRRTLDQAVKAEEYAQPGLAPRELRGKLAFILANQAYFESDGEVVSEDVTSRLRVVHRRLLHLSDHVTRLVGCLKLSYERFETVEGRTPVRAAQFTIIERIFRLIGFGRERHIADLPICDRETVHLLTGTHFLDVFAALRPLLYCNDELRGRFLALELLIADHRDYQVGPDYPIFTSFDRAELDVWVRAQGRQPTNEAPLQFYQIPLGDEVLCDLFGNANGPILPKIASRKPAPSGAPKSDPPPNPHP